MPAIPKPPFVVHDTAAYAGSGLKAAKYVMTRRVDTFHVGVGYFISKGKVDMLTVHDRDFASRRYVVTTDDAEKFVRDMVSLAKTKGGSTEAFLLLGEKNMAKLSRRQAAVAPEPEPDEPEEEAPAPAPKGRRGRVAAAAPEPEPEPEEAPTAKAKRGAAKAVRAAAKVAPAPTAKKVVGRSNIPDTAKIKILTNKKENPYRPDTKAAATFDLMVESATVGEFRDNVDTDEHDPGYLRYASRDGYVEFV